MKKKLTFKQLATKYDVISCQHRKMFINGEAYNGYFCKIDNHYQPLTITQKVELAEYDNVKIFDGFSQYAPEQRFTYVYLIGSKCKKSC